MRRVVFPAIVAVVMSLGVPPAVRAGDGPADPVKQPHEKDDPLEEKRKSISDLKTEFATLPPVEATSIYNVVRFGLRHGALTLATDLRPSEPKMRVVVPGLTGFASFEPLQPDGDAKDEPKFFRFLNRDLSGPGSMQVWTTVSAEGEGRLGVARDWEDENYSYTVEYRQAPFDPDANADQQPIHLYVSKSSLTTGMQTAKSEYGATSFEELRKNYSDVLNEHLRPIFRDLGQEGVVFGIDSRVAWQVLGGDEPQDPAVSDKLAGVIERLKAPAYSDRSAAADELETLGQAGALVLMKMDRSPWNAEQRTAIETFLEQYQTLSQADIENRRKSLPFLVDALYCEEIALRSKAFSRLKELVPTPLKFDPAASAAERDAAIARLRIDLLNHPATSPSMIAPTSSSAPSLRPAS